MGYYDNTDLPFYYFLANTFAIGDHSLLVRARFDVAQSRLPLGGDF